MIKKASISGLKFFLAVFSAFTIFVCYADKDIQR